MSTTKENLQKIYNLSFKSMNTINCVIDGIEKQSLARIAMVKKYSDAWRVSCTINESSTIASDLSKHLGLYLSPKWNKDFPDNQTAREKNKSIFWYGVRDNIQDIFKIINHKQLKSFISINADLTYYVNNGWNIKLVKPFMNGRYDYEITDDLLQLIHMTQVICNNFNARE